MRRIVALAMTGLLALGGQTACSSNEESPEFPVTEESAPPAFAPNAGIRFICEPAGPRVEYLSPLGDSQLEEVKAAFSLSEPQQLGNTCSVLLSFVNAGWADTVSKLPVESGAEPNTFVVEPRARAANDVTVLTVTEDDGKIVMFFQDSTHLAGTPFEFEHGLTFRVPDSYLK